MAARKKPAKKPVRRPRATREAQFTVVLEDLRSQFAVFGEALQAHGERTSRQLAEVRSELSALGEETRRELLEVRKDLALVQSATLSNSRDLRAIQEDVRRLREDVQRVDAKVDDHGKRLATLEGAAQ